LKIGSCDYPDSLLYDVEAGTWARKEANVFRLGIAPHLSWISGGFTSVSFKRAGSRVEKGRSLGSVEGPRHFDVVRAPFDGVVAEMNSRLIAEPRLANKDPFGSGWFALLEQVGASSNLRSLAEVADSIATTVGRLGIHCFAEFPDTEMFEIGVECSAVLVRLNEQLARSSSGTVVHIVSDDPTSDVEMTRWESQTGNSVLESRREGSLYHFIVKKS
jgi:glycine cleavage system H lipoate-binding protein/TusA-related sulfurtransferase